MRKTGIFLASVTFSLILVFGNVVNSYSEYMPPKKQLESGILPEDIMCNEGKVLVIRYNGNPACVSERTAEKKGWKIIKTEFKIQKIQDILSALSADLSNVVLSSKVLEGNYTTGLWSESMKGVTRAPAPSLIDNVYNAIILPDGSPLLSDLTREHSGLSVQAFVQKNTQAKTPNDYTKYFPTYIPDGLELKFFTFGSTVYTSEEYPGLDEEYEGLSGASLYLVYLPIPVDIDPTQITGEKTMDLGGIIITLSDSPANVKYLEDEHINKMQTLGGHTLTVTDDVNIFWGGIETSLLISPQVLVRIESLGNSPQEMLQMAESIITNLE